MGDVMNHITITTVCLILILFQCAKGANYYIDFDKGSNAVTTPTKTAPWKCHPYMKNFSGKYTHVSGDKFFFKGGVTWPDSCFCMSITQGGKTNLPDYYGADTSWFTGKSFKKPVFDAGQKVLSGAQKIIDLNYLTNITIDNMEIKGLLINTNNNFMLASVSAYDCEYITVKRCYIHDWSVSSSVTADGMFGGVTFNNPNPPTPGRGNVIDSCEISDSAMGGNCGYGVRCVETVKNCNIHHVPNGILGSSHLVCRNTIHDVHGSFDPNEHENGLYVFGWDSAGGPAYMYNNIIYNVDMMPLYVAPGWKTEGIAYIFNNVLYNNTRGIEIDPEQATAKTRMYVYIYNNTIANGSVRVTPRGGPAIKKLVMANNHYIGDIPVDGKPMAIYNSPPNGGTVDTAIDSNNLIMSPAVATSYGYALANHYAPTKSNSPTVDKGISEASIFKTDFLNKPRPVGRAWDIGAYEFPSSTGPINPPNPMDTIKSQKKSNSTIIQRGTLGLHDGIEMFNTQGIRCNRTAPGSSMYFVKKKNKGSLSRIIVF
jgi:hypothetical protein